LGNNQVISQTGFFYIHFSLRLALHCGSSNGKPARRNKNQKLLGVTRNTARPTVANEDIARYPVEKTNGNIRLPTRASAVIRIVKEIEKTIENPQNIHPVPN
jgi:hypothetical protein